MADCEQPPDLKPNREPLGRGHQLRVDIAVSLSLLPAWVRRALADRNPEKARAGRAEVVERIAASLERRFRITWLGSDDGSENARAPARPVPLFGVDSSIVVQGEIVRSNPKSIDSDSQSDGT